MARLSEGFEKRVCISIRLYIVKYIIVWKSEVFDDLATLYAIHLIEWNLSEINVPKLLQARADM